MHQDYELSICDTLNQLVFSVKMKNLQLKISSKDPVKGIKRMESENNLVFHVLDDRNLSQFVFI